MSSYYGPQRGRATAGGGGGGGGSVILYPITYYEIAIDPANALVTLTAEASGMMVGTGGASYAWLLSGLASAYEIRADVSSGSLSSGTTGSWLNMGTDRSWTVSRTTLGTNSCTLQFQIRRVSDGVVLDTEYKALQASVEPDEGGGGGGGA